MKIMSFIAKACSFGNEGAYGNGFLSRYPIKSAETVIIPDPNPRAYNGYYETRCILMGDFNIEPDNELLEPLKERTNDTGALLSGEPKSFPSDNPRIKIDYIWTSKDIEVISADIPPLIASDHRPHIAEIK